MRLSIILGTVASLSLLSAAALATTLPPIPQKCPGIAALKDGGVSRIVIQMDNRWFAGRRHLMYDTTDMWTFVIGNIDVTNANDAYAKAAISLPSIAFRMGPFEASDHWVCLYNTADNNLPAITITNPIALAESAKYFQ